MKGSSGSDKTDRQHRAFFVSDLHGRAHRYDQLFKAILRERPDMVFLGGDLLPPFGRYSDPVHEDFLKHFLRPNLETIRTSLREVYPQIFFIFGNDDPKAEEEAALKLEKEGLWIYAQDRWIPVGPYSVFGYAYVPPTPFRLKDWERYDVSRYVDPGCISPAEGIHTTSVSESVLKYATIRQDLEQSATAENLSKTIFLFHGPPYKTNLDRAALDGKEIDRVPLDLHVGSIALRRFIEARQPMLTLHGHIHESARIMGSWKDRIGRTHLFSAAHDGPELALIRFDPENLENASRELL